MVRHAIYKYILVLRILGGESDRDKKTAAAAGTHCKHPRLVYPAQLCFLYPFIDTLGVANFSHASEATVAITKSVQKLLVLL